MCVSDVKKLRNIINLQVTLAIHNNSHACAQHLAALVCEYSASSHITGKNGIYVSPEFCNGIYIYAGGGAQLAIIIESTYTGVEESFSYSREE